MSAGEGEWVIVCTGYEPGPRRPPVVPEGQLLEDLQLGGPRLGTCWTFEPGRAMHFASLDAAQQAWRATGRAGVRPGEGLRVEYRQLTEIAERI